MNIVEATKLINELINSAEYREIYGGASNEPVNVALEIAVDSMQKQELVKPIKGSINPDKTQQYSCPNCGRLWWEWNFVTEYCGSCGQRIDLSDRGFANTIDEIMAHIGIDMSTKSDFSPSDIIPRKQAKDDN